MLTLSSLAYVTLMVENHYMATCQWDSKDWVLVDVCWTKKNKLQYKIFKFKRNWHQISNSSDSSWITDVSHTTLSGKCCLYEIDIYGDLYWRSCTQKLADLSKPAGVYFFFFSIFFYNQSCFTLNLSTKILTFQKSRLTFRPQECLFFLRKKCFLPSLSCNIYSFFFFSGIIWVLLPWQKML